MTNQVMPAVFIGHGNPMYAIEPNAYTAGWAQLAASLPRPKAILCISAHWYTQGTGVTAMLAPRTIHDFGRFPQALFDVQYPAPGDPALAARIIDLLQPLGVISDTSWGLDHGTWSVLVHAFPQADIPVLQLSIDGTKPNSFHYELGQRLSALRDEGVLIIGSGNVVHNLSLVKWQGDATPFDWATSFNDAVRDHITRSDHAPLIDYEAMGEPALLSIPTPDHYLPLLYVLGAIRPSDKVTFPVDGIDMGSLSMLCVLAQ
ncbi:MAG: 4,5-DOPA dioxygenase extradiol [Parvibaculaceae bacterium]